MCRAAMRGLEPEAAPAPPPGSTKLSLSISSLAAHSRRTAATTPVRRRR